MKNPAPDRKKDLLRTAIRLFKKGGFANVSVEDIVRAGETSIATFYSYFPAKEEIICLHRNSALERCYAFYRKLVEGEEYFALDELQKLRELLLYLLRNLNKTGAAFGRVFIKYRIKEHNATLEDTLYVELIRELIERGQAAGIIRQDYSAAQLTSITNQALIGAYIRWQLHCSIMPLHEACGEAIDAHCRLLGSAAPAKQQRSFNEVWETALYMLIPDPRSGIKQMEENWLERFYKA